MAEVVNDKTRILEESCTEPESGTLSVTNGACKREVEHTASELTPGHDVYEVLGGLPDLGYNIFPDDASFTALVREGELALDAGIHARLNPKGTSGCYFIMDREQVRWFVTVVLHM